MTELEQEVMKHFTMITVAGGAKRKSTWGSRNNWRVTLKNKKTRRQCSFDFFGGSAVTEVSVGDVIYSLISDSAGGEMDLLDFVNEFEYDISDSEGRELANKVWNLCKDQWRNMTRIMDSDLREQLSVLEH